MKMRSLLLAAVLSVAAPAAANAAVAVTMSNTVGGQLNNPPFTLGWAFTANSAIIAQSLGFFDSSLDGLAESHELGLWTSTGTLLASTTIGAGTSGTLINQFRYSTIAPTLLLPGNYLVGGVFASGADRLIVNPSAFGTDPAISYQGARFASGGSLTAPTASGGPEGYFGMNFTFNSAGVPEPATWAMMIIGFGAIGASMRAARRKIDFAVA